MKTIFDIRKPSINNNLSFFSRFMELELFTYINEFELMTQVFREKSVNIDNQKFILRLIEDINIFNILIYIIKRSIYYQLKGYNSS